MPLIVYRLPHSPTLDAFDESIEIIDTFIEETLLSWWVVVELNKDDEPTILRTADETSYLPPWERERKESDIDRRPGPHQDYYQLEDGMELDPIEDLYWS